ncbi:hypothetical protein B0J12DRAFT_738504 [Macrophomina phaseolina]|uniref:Uncharacterized protein n=1 Tax=Macrophomina phaseolina TaxID=35725 RepID=A0ABQ8GH58_9PEZI|nr:hypothetical protein B0J12DRAFT_738504 [Macrophomina phaseolina]
MAGFPLLNMAEIPKNMPRPGEQWNKDELEPMLEGAFKAAMPLKKDRTSGYKDLVTDIMRHNYATVGKPPLARHPTTEESDEEWLREHLKKQWAMRSKTKAWKELQIRRVDVSQANRRGVECGKPFSRSDEKWKQVDEKKLKDEVNKSMWRECGEAVLKDWKEQWSQELSEKVQELMSLQAMVDFQRAEHTARMKGLKTSISEAISQTEALAEIAHSRLQVLDHEVDTAQALLEISSKSMRRLRTRVSRLAAKDVINDGVRKQVMRERLAHPKALSFMFQGQKDLEAAKAVADSTRRFVASMDADWGSVSSAAMDTISGLKDAILAIDLGRRCPGKYTWESGPCAQY